MTGAIVIDTPEGIAMYRLLSIRSAIKLEILGMRHSRGSVYALAKREYGLKGSRAKVLEQLERMVSEGRTK